MKPKCFFSYCWDDDAKLIEYLVHEVEEQSEHRIEVIYDRKSFQLNDDIDMSEAKILEADVVVFFSSPNFRKIIDSSEENRGVYREYCHILAKNDEYPEAVIPVIYKGTKADSMPREFHRRIHTDLSQVSIVRYKGKDHVKKEFQNTVRQLVKHIIKQTDNMFKYRDIYTNHQTESEKYETLLYISASDNKLPRSCMVGLDVYRKILDQTAYFVVGRKGSGKTTLLEVLEKMDPAAFNIKYKALFPINAEHIELTILYSVYRENVDENILPTSLILDVFWELYITMHAIIGVCIEDENHHILDDRQEIFKRARNVLKKELHIDRLGYAATQEGLFALCTGLLESFTKTGIVEHAVSGSSYLGSLRTNFNVYNIVEKFFRKPLTAQLYNAIACCTKRILISLDGFDTNSDNFRMDTNYMFSDPSKQTEVYKRINFEKTFYRSLVQQVIKIKEGKTFSKNSKVTNLLDFCLVLPKDRLDQIETIDRDFSKKKFADLRWDAVELLKMIVLRLEHIGNVSIPEGYSLMERFEHAMKKLAPEIPLKVEIDINGQKSFLDLFQYVLRLSFWNPRDIIKHFGSLLAAARNSRDSKSVTEKIPSSTIKELLNRMTLTIIEKEFFREYLHVFYNIKDVVGQFQDSNMILDTIELYERLNNIKFITCVEYDCSHIEQKIRILYEMAVLGIIFTSTDTQKYGYDSNICFIFNEGIEPIKTYFRSTSQNQTRCKFMLNPIFTKYSCLNINSNRVVGDWGWDYLESNHQRKTTINII